MYKFRTARSFKLSYEKLTENNEPIKKRLQITLQKLSQDPKSNSLQSHKVNTSKYGACWSSRVTGDIRILWDYNSSEQLIILLLDIGRHSGSRKVYK